MPSVPITQALSPLCMATAKHWIKKGDDLVSPATLLILWPSSFKKGKVCPAPLAGSNAMDPAPLAGSNAMDPALLAGSNAMDPAPLAGSNVMDPAPLAGSNVMDPAPLAGMRWIQHHWLECDGSSTTGWK